MLEGKDLELWNEVFKSSVEYAAKKILPLVQLEYPTPEIRVKVLELMKQFLPDYEIKCDEENNPFDVIDSGQIKMRIFNSNNIDYFDLTF